MGFVSGLLKAGVAKKIYDEARKPHNQKKIKDAISSVTSGKRGGTGRGPTGGTHR